MYRNQKPYKASLSAVVSKTRVKLLCKSLHFPLCQPHPRQKGLVINHGKMGGGGWELKKWKLFTFSISCTVNWGSLLHPNSARPKLPAVKLPQNLEVRRWVTFDWFLAGILVTNS